MGFNDKMSTISKAERKQIEAFEGEQRSQMRGDRDERLQAYSDTKDKSSVALSKKDQLRRNKLIENDRNTARMMLAMSNVRGIEEQQNLQCSQLMMRIMGGVGLFIGCVMFIVSIVIMSTPCCGSAWEYEEEECKVDLIENNIDAAFRNDDAKEETSCYMRTRYLIVSYAFTVLLLLIGTIIVVIGECCYGINEIEDEDKMIDTARHLKWCEMEEMERGREAKNREREIASIQEDREEELQRRIEELEYQRELDIQSGRLRTHSLPVGHHSTPYVYGHSRPFVV